MDNKIEQDSFDWLMNTQECDKEIDTIVEWILKDKQLCKSITSQLDIDNTGQASQQTDHKRQTNPISLLCEEKIQTFDSETNLRDEMTKYNQNVVSSTTNLIKWIQDIEENPHNTSEIQTVTEKTNGITKMLINLTNEKHGLMKKIQTLDHNSKHILQPPNTIMLYEEIIEQTLNAFNVNTKRSPFDEPKQ